MTDLIYTIFPDKVLVILDGEIFEVYEGDLNYEALLEAVKNDDVKAIKELVNIKAQVASYVDGNWEITEDGQVLYKDKPVEGPMIDLILEFYERGLPFNHLTRFYEKLQQNPSYRSRQQLWNFLAKYEFPILPNGNFLAYKGVEADRYDRHSRSIKYEDGAVVEMDRSQVSDDPMDACAPGLHVGTYSYANSWARDNGVVILVEVNPRDVVRVPYDHDHQKCATCKLFVKGEIKRKLKETPRIDWTPEMFGYTPQEECLLGDNDVC